MEIILTLAILLAASVAILSIGGLVARLKFHASRSDFVNTQLTYQALLLCVALAVVFAIFLIDQRNFSKFFAVGRIAAPARGVPLLGIPGGHSWLVIGTYLSVVITLVTATFIYFNFRGSVGKAGLLLPLFPWILLFSVTNAFAEEVIYRFGVVIPLFGHVDPAAILLISAFAFGATHFRGVPGGPVGVLMAGLLGWLLAKSVIETSGLFWAWSIHSLQDVVIFSALALSAALKRQAATMRPPSPEASAAARQLRG